MKKTLLALVLPALLAGCNPSDNDSQPPAPAAQAHEFLVQLSSGAEGIGARPTGTEAETRAAAWIQDHLAGWGYEVQNQPFTYTRGGTDRTSQNIVAELKGQSDKVILIGAHYDSTGEKKGSEGATDNGAGVAALLAVAEALKGETLPYTVRFAFFGAEENGLNGSKAYAASLDADAVAKLDAAKQAVKDAESAKAAADVELANAKTAKDTADAAVTAAQQKVDEAQAKLDSADAQLKQGAIGFFRAMGADSAIEIIQNPVILQAINPLYAIDFIVERPVVAFITPGRRGALRDGHGGALRRHGPFRPPSDQAGMVRSGAALHLHELSRSGRLAAQRTRSGQ